MPEMLAMTEGAGGLFDFNATLPLMAIQFILLTVVLTFVFYKPVSKVIDDRETYINDNLTTASEKLIKADELYNEYDEQLKTARVNAQAIIAQSEKEAKDVLCKIKGIGPWTVENFLIFSGNNKDICPANDLGLKKGIKKIYNLDKLPSDDEVYSISENWRPYRSVAVRYIWEIVDQDINF